MIKRRCRSCGAPYTMSVPAILAYEKAGQTVPGHCKQCRRINRLEKEVKLLKKVCYKLSTKPKIT